MVYRDAFLRELDDRLSAEGLDRDLRLGLLDESAAHLGASIQARMETGDPEEVAERDAVAAFGTAKAFAGGMSAAMLPSVTNRLRPVRILGGLGTIAFGIGVLSGTAFLLIPCLVLTALCGLGVAASSYRARKADLIGLAAIGGAAGLALWMGMSVLWISPGHHGGLGYLQRWAVPSAEHDASVEAQRLETVAAEFRVGAAAFSVPGTNPMLVAESLGLRRGNHVLTPNSVGRGLLTNLYYREDRPEMAVAGWRWTALRMAEAAEEYAQESRGQAAAVEAAASVPATENLRTMAPVALPLLPFFVFGLWFLSGVGTALGLIVRGVRLWTRRMRHV